MVERYFGINRPETPAMMIHQELTARQRILEDEHGGLAGFDITPPEVQVAQLANGNTMTLIDTTLLPGGAFKYLSGVANLIVLPEEIKEVVIATAGNAGKALGQAAMRVGKRSIAFSPRDLTHIKRSGMEDAGMDVISDSYDVAEAMDMAEAYVSARQHTAALIHPYNNLWGLAGLRCMGADIASTLRKLSADGSLDLKNPTDVTVAVGGGSGVTGVASGLYSHKVNDGLLQNVSVFAVRPQRLPGGEMNPIFDGLRVAVPGNNTAPFLEDRRFVAGTRYVSESNVADGTRLLSTLSDTMYEPNAVVAVAAVTKWVADNPGADSRNFVAVLTGRNTNPDHHEYFMNLRGYKESDEYARRMADRERRVAADLAQVAIKNNLVVTQDVVRHGARPGMAVLRGVVAR